jgi:hypothetical protein
MVKRKAEEALGLADAPPASVKVSFENLPP